MRLSNANIIIADNTTGSDPLSVVNFAIKEFNKDSIYDHVYCVFDRDKQLEEFHKISGTDNPLTRIHELVEYLMTLEK